ncbi:MAG: triose-phosphate isomerase [Gemmataceae bacterium]
MRKMFVAGNWKMNTTAQAAHDLAKAIVQGVGAGPSTTVAMCPPFPYLAKVAEVVQGSPVALGAQNIYPEEKGAFTGEVSAAMLLDVGCQYVILGHSERRHVIGETDEFINQKVKFAIAAGLQVIFCVGEKLEEREGNQTEAVLNTQVTKGLDGVTAEQLSKLVIAYEPVWAIGTGKTATPDQAQEAHAFLRKRIGELYSADVAQNLVMQYGGSVKPENAKELLGQPDVDGALVGGASLKPDQFVAIIQAAG